MVEINADVMTLAQLTAEFDATDVTPKTNIGNPILLASLTKTETEWGSLEGWQSALNNSHGITQTALAQLKVLYPNKIINLEGLYVTLNVV